MTFARAFAVSFFISSIFSIILVSILFFAVLWSNKYLGPSWGRDPEAILGILVGALAVAVISILLVGVVAK